MTECVWRYRGALAEATYYFAWYSLPQWNRSRLSRALCKLSIISFGIAELCGRQEMPRNILESVRRRQLADESVGDVFSSNSLDGKGISHITAERAAMLGGMTLSSLRGDADAMPRPALLTVAATMVATFAVFDWGMCKILDIPRKRGYRFAHTGLALAVASFVAGVEFLVDNSEQIVAATERAYGVGDRCGTSGGSCCGSSDNSGCCSCRE